MNDFSDTWNFLDIDQLQMLIDAIDELENNVAIQIHGGRIDAVPGLQELARWRDQLQELLDKMDEYE